MYKILSLDGGGSWSILQLLTLKEKYGNATGHEILRDFDLVVANSGGSIVLAALAENYPIDKAIEIFDSEENRRSIFCKNSFWNRFFPIDYLRLISSFGPRYSAPKKRKAFESFFRSIKNTPMEELPSMIGKDSLRIVVATYDALNNRAKFFKSWDSSKEDFDSVSLIEAIHGSSNAPIQYFDFPARFKADKSEIYYEIWDGALGGFNNPVVAGIIEAIKEGISMENVSVVSLGTGSKLMSTEDKSAFYQARYQTTRNRRKKWKLWKLPIQLTYFSKTVLNQAKTILYEPPDWANYVAMMFLKLGQNKDIPNNFIRLSPMIHMDKNTPDEACELIKQLYQLDMDLVKDKDIQLVKEAFHAWKDGTITNQPVSYKIKRDNTLVYIEGDKYFKDAMKKW